MASATSPAPVLPSTRGNAARKWKPSLVRPRPGTPSGTASCAFLLTSDSYESPSLNSILVPNRSLIPDLNSDHLLVEATTWMPYPRPRAARSVITVSRLSYSCLIVSHPSTTRNTSPQPSLWMLPSAAMRR